MILRRENVSLGSIPVGRITIAPTAQKTYQTVPSSAPGIEWATLTIPAAAATGYLLTTSATAAEGVAWQAPAVPTALTTFTAVAGTFSGDVHAATGTFTGAATASTVATTSGIAAWGTALPSTQPTASGVTAGYSVGSTGAVNSDSTFTGGSGTQTTAYTIGDVVFCLKAQGLLAP
jgi:hypothetical protein